MIYGTEKFNEFYDTKIYPLLKALEPGRQKRLLNYKVTNLFLIFMTLMPLVVLIMLFINVRGGSVYDLLAFIFAIPICIMISYIFVMMFIFHKTKTPKNFCRYIKKVCIKDIISCFDNLKYNDQEIPANLFTESGLFSKFNNIIRDDIYTGKYQDVWFHLEEVRLRMYGMLTSRFGALSFSGAVMIFPTNKTVKSQTIIASKKDSNINNLQPYAIPTMIMLLCMIIISLIIIFFSQEINLRIIIFTLVNIFLLIYVIFDTIIKSQNYESVKLEDIGFDERFIVQSKDQIEARYLVTPTFMDRLQKLQTAFGTKNIKCSFFGNKVMFTISTERDLFEIGDLFTPLTDPSQMQKFMEELTAVYDIIDYFKLAENTGL